MTNDASPESRAPVRFVCLRCHRVFASAASCPDDGSPVVLDRSDQILAERYKLKHPVGIGGAGALWEAEQLALGRQVAIRLVSARDEEAVARVRRGAAVMAKMAHPNIVTLHDFGEYEGPYGPELFLVTEHLEGAPLKRFSARDALSIEYAVSATAQTLRALEHMHRRGFIHRDIKPANLFVTTVDDDRFVVKLLDFGIARASDAAEPEVAKEPASEGRGGKRRVTQHMRILGTPEYMAPEQILGQSLDARVDVYAAGVLFFMLLFGRMPFTGGDRFALYQAHLGGKLPSMSELVMATPSATAAWQDFFGLALAKSPAERFPSAKAMMDAMFKLPRVNLMTG